MDREHPLEDVLDKAAEAAEGDQVKIADILDLYGDRSFRPILLLLGLIAVIPPMGAIPGVSAAVGIVIILFSVQMLLGRKQSGCPASSPTGPSTKTSSARPTRNRRRFCRPSTTW